MLDLIIVLAAVVAVAGGWRLGLITRGLGWVGAILGVTLAVSIVPALTRWIGPPSDTGLLLLTVGTFVLLVSAGQAIGSAIGSRLRPHPRDRLVRRLDSAGGAVLGVLGVAVLVWLLVPLMSQTDGWVASATRSSFFARAAADHLPEPPEPVQELERRLVEGNFPELFAGLRPAPDLPAPPAGSPVDDATLRRVADSTARVRGQACDLNQSGSAFSVGDGLWVTNAHVVAGTQSVRLLTPDGAVATGSVVAFDPREDLAVVRTELSRPALALADASEGDSGLVMGFPGGGALQPSPFLVGETLTATGYDIYDDALVRRDLLVLSAELEPGDSGSALVDGGGRVLGVAVAVAPDRPGVAYALESDSVASLLGSVGSSAVGTGSCIG